MPALVYTPADFVPFTKILSADVNSKFTSIQTLLNTTKLDDDNIQDDGITASDKLADETLTADKVNGSGVPKGGMLITDGSSGADLTGVLSRAGTCINVGLAKSGDVIKLVQADGNTFSTAENAGHVIVPSTTDGQVEMLSLTSDTHFIDGNTAGTSDMVTLFGDTTAIAWSSERPFFIYACNTSVGLRCFISLSPVLTATPASATNQSYNGGGAASAGSSQNNIHWMSDTNLTGETSRPCTRIGGLTATKDASDNWVFSAVGTAPNDGIRPDPFQGVTFQLNPGQNGNQTDRYVKQNGGNAPLFSAQNHTYQVRLDGTIVGHLNLDGDGGGTANGAVTAFVGLPYYAFDNLGASAVGTSTGAFDILVGGTTRSIALGYVTPGTTDMSFRTDSGASTLTLIQNQDFASGNRRIVGRYEFSAFNTGGIL